jgi:hypothetical protein
MFEPDETIPTIELHDFDEATLQVLRALQTALLKHPIACQAAFNALVAEGAKFAATPEGREWNAKLENSTLIHQLRYVFDLTTFSLLERESPDILPSAYIDTLFMLSGADRSDHLLDRLFRELEPR